MPAARDLLRALVVVIKALATKYGVTTSGLSVHTVTPAELKKHYTKLLKKVHPDKGGSDADFRKLHEAYEQWQQQPQRGLPARPTPNNHGDAGDTEECVTQLPGSKKVYEIRSEAVMLTYFRIHDLAQWDRFLQWVGGQVGQGGIKHWCATLEECPKTNSWHIHLMVQFHTAVRTRTVNDFKFENLTCNASCNDYQQ